LNQPERRNALSAELIAGLGQNLENAMNDPAVRLSVTGRPGVLRRRRPQERWRAVRRRPHRASIRAHSQDDLGGSQAGNRRINGHAFGGGVGLTAACDLTVAADSAKFSFSEVRVGVVPAMISVVVIPRSEFTTPCGSF
jgi:hypothetical protein